MNPKSTGLIKYFGLPQMRSPQKASPILHRSKSSQPVTWKARNFVADYNAIVQKLNADLSKINALIDHYNTDSEAEDLPSKIKILQALQGSYLSILKKYPHHFIRFCPSFISKIQEGLFDQIKSEQEKLSLSEETEVLHANPSRLLSSILGHMGSQKIKQLLAIMIHPNDFSQNMQGLYQKEEPGYQDFRIFLRSLRNITLLSKGNSINYQLNFNAPHPPLVLKANNRLGNSARAEDLLRKDLAFKQNFIPVLAERQATIIVKGRAVTRSIVLTPFGGVDLKEMGELLHSKNNIAETLQRAHNYFLQIARFLERCRYAKIGHPDAKLSNYLVNHDNLIWIADTKSLVPLHEDGSFNLDDHYFRDGLIFSTFMRPPEFLGKKCDAEQIHAYMLGKNLYKFLTNCSNSYLSDNHNGQDYNFHHPIFATKEGNIYRYLISQLIQPEPDTRMYVHDFMLALKEMDLELTQKKILCRQLIRKYYEYSFHSKTENWQPLVSQYNEAVDRANRDSIESLIKDLESKVLRVGKEHCLRLLKQISSIYTNPPELKENIRVIEEAVLADEIQSLEEELADILAKKIEQQQQQYLDKRKKACFDLLFQIDQTMPTTGLQDSPSLYKYYQPKINAATEKNIEKIAGKLEATLAYYGNLKAGMGNTSYSYPPQACFFKYTKAQRRCLKVRVEEVEKDCRSFVKLPTIEESEENSQSRHCERSEAIQWP